MAVSETRAFADPDEVRTFDHGRIETVKIGGGEVGRVTLEPGWRWSTDVKPIAGTELCMAPHFGYQLSGRLRVRMADGSEFETVADEVCTIAPGHDAWVVGDETVTMIDWGAAANYAR